MGLLPHVVLSSPHWDVQAKARLQKWPLTRGEQMVGLNVPLVLPAPATLAALIIVLLSMSWAPGSGLPWDYLPGTSQ